MSNTKRQPRRKERLSVSSYARPYSLDTLNQYLDEHGYAGISVVQENGEFLFTGEPTKEWKDKRTYVDKIRQLSYGQWLDEADYKLYIYKPKGDNNNEDTVPHTQ